MARITHYALGYMWVPQATFTVGGTPTDPTTLTVKQQAPSGTETVLANAVSPGSLTTTSEPVARVSAGVFKLKPGIALDTAGYWYVKFTGTGAAAAAVTHEAIADPDVFTAESGIGARALVGLGETKDWLQQQNIDITGDLELVRVINDISDAFHDEAGGREFKPLGTNPQARTFVADSVGWLHGIITVGDMASVTTVEILDRDGATVLQTVAAANYDLLPLDRKPGEPVRQIQLNYANGVMWLRPGYRVRVTGSYGFQAVPGNVRRAVLDAVVAELDRPVESYSQDLAPATSGAATNVVMMSSRPQFLSLPAKTLTVAWHYRDPLAG